MNLNIERVLYLALTFLFTIGKIKFNDNMIERVEKNNNDFKKLIIYSLRDREKLKEYEFNPKGLNIILGEKEKTKMKLMVSVKQLWWIVYKCY